MSEQETPSPYAEAQALKASGATPDTIAARLSGRGLNAEEVALMLNAVGVSVPIPVAAAPGLSLPTAFVATPGTQAPQLGPPPSTVCTRCGVFISETWVPVLGKAYCPACAERDDVNYPRAYRNANWGKRDGWAWFIGITGLMGLLVGAPAVINAPLLGIGILLSSVAQLLFWSGAQIGRPALVAGSVLAVVLTVANGLPPNIIAIGLIVAAMRSTRTKLFFQIEVPEAELAAAWMQQHDNRPAAYSLTLGCIALATMITWPGSWKFAVATGVLASLALITGVIGLRNVKPDAHPPVGKKGVAIGGLVTGSLALLFSAVFVVWSLTLH